MKTNHFIVLLIALTLFSCETTKEQGSITDFGRVFVSSNTQAQIGVYDFSDSENISKIEFVTTINDADGIYYDGSRDIVYQADREHDRINAFAKLSTNEASSGILPTAISTSDFTNPRGLTSEGNIAIIAQDADDTNTLQNALFMYDVSGDVISLRNEYMVDFPLWDIQLVGNTLYAVEDESDSLAIFNNFLGNADGLIQPDFKISIEGITRTHGIYYFLSNDLMIMTDIGEASASVQDGKIIIIEDFNLKLSRALQEPENTISSVDMMIISGSNTMLRNPVDVVFHEQANQIIVAERATNGGMILAFEYPVQVGEENEFNQIPSFTTNYSGASGLFINNN